jgi:hypothetical protein
MAHVGTRERQDSIAQHFSIASEGGSHFTKLANRAKEANCDRRPLPAKCAGWEIWACRQTPFTSQDLLTSRQSIRTGVIFGLIRRPDPADKAGGTVINAPTHQAAQMGASGHGLRTAS